jgi:hypothetical protein
MHLGRRPWAGWEGAGVGFHKHRVQYWGGRLAGALAGRGDGPLADSLRVGVGMPRPWRVKAVRGDGQVVPSSAAATLTLPSCSAS